MLQLGSQTFEVDGVTVFRDHADPDQFWYLATEVVLRTRSDGRAAFSFLQYRPDVKDAGIEGGGFLMLETAVSLPAATRSKIMGQAQALAPNPRLAAAPVESGSVRCLALNLEGPGGTTAPPGAFAPVTRIMGAAKPSLVGEETAAFSLVLDEAGATILEAAFANGLTPIGVVYDLTYSALTPDLHVEITADLDRVYTHFSAGLEAQIYWLRVGIDAGFEELVANGAIKIKVIDFEGTGDQAEKWALDFFKTDLLSKWFEPSLSLGKLQGPTQPEGLDAIFERAKKLIKPGSPSGGGTPPGGTPPGGTPPGGTPPGGTPPGGHPPGGSPPGGSPPGGSPPGGTPPGGSPSGGSPPGGSPPGGSPPGGSPPGGTPPPPPPPPPGGAPSPQESAGASIPALVSFKLKVLRQEERKKVTLVFERRKAVKRTYAPQGFVGLLLDDLADKSSYFLKVDLADSFFKKIDVDVATPVNFADIGLFATDVAIEYGGDGPEDFRLTQAAPGPARFTTFLNAARDLDFTVGMEHHFHANSGWIGEKLSYQVPPRRTKDRTLKADPQDDLGFLKLEIFPNRIDPGIVDAVDVDLRYDDGHTFQRRDIFRVRPKDVAQQWRLRLTRPAERSWTAQLTHHLSDGTTRVTPAFSGDASFLPVNDPFPDSLDILALPLFEPGTVRMAFLEVEYDDPANNYHRRARLEVPGAAVSPLPLRVALIDPGRREFRHQITIIRQDGALIRHPQVRGVDTLIGIHL
ncbi:hypothetical protein [Nonomuraea endophytica]|uniref:Uncharacterized protein n=1 Tax=Nonomuraea endophytica TaxID=714136 RepID=A0A7W8ADZ0_9ACTN|nr:hypothetical protein [Nonomuraea endophytica]MBB5084427.1 hypothetical protein [Nonomuraea endophytica]